MKTELSPNVREDIELRRMVFSVEDNGIGISAEDLKRLFTPFTQVDSSLSRQYEGTGLGLALVRPELHGGSVSVESAEGRGSRFQVPFPSRLQTKSMKKTDGRYKIHQKTTTLRSKVKADASCLRMTTL